MLPLQIQVPIFLSAHVIYKLHLAAYHVTYSLHVLLSTMSVYNLYLTVYHVSHFTFGVYHVDRVTYRCAYKYV